MFITNKAIIIKSYLKFKPFRKMFKVVVKLHVWRVWISFTICPMDHKLRNNIIAK